MNNIIEILNLKKKFNISNNQHLILLKNLDLKIAKNSITSIIGPSGSGKSSLLNILGLLDSNFTGHYKFDGTIVNSMNSNLLSNIRNQKIGFVHQFFHLIPELSVIENIILPGLINSNKVSIIMDEAIKLLEAFEISDKKNIKPSKLSGGEQQRVAIARSLINKPNLILADEITGNLDEKTADDIIIFFLKFIRNHNLSLLFVTHNQKYAEMATFKYELKNKNLTLK